MNKVFLVGRLTKDPEEMPKGKEQSVAVVKYPLAVARKKCEELDKKADYITCTAFGSDAAFALKHFKKGMMVVVLAKIQTGSYINKDGQKVYTTDIVIVDQEFGENKTKPEEFRPAPFVDDFEQERLVEPPEPVRRGRR